MSCPGIGKGIYTLNSNESDRPYFAYWSRLIWSGIKYDLYEQTVSVLYLGLDITYLFWLNNTNFYLIFTIIELWHHA
jgi:hypothetical protein